MSIVQKKKYILLDQDQYAKNITAGFEKVFKYSFKGKQSPLPTKFTPSKKDSPTTEKQIIETKIEIRKYKLQISNWSSFNV